MHQRISASTALMLTVAPLMWAGNAVVGRVVNTMVPPITLNFLRWAIALAILLPIAYPILKPGSPLWKHWRRFAVLGLLGIGLYNAFQYLALQSSTPINVTLVAASMPVWMLLTGWLFFRAPVSRRQIFGAVLSIGGVLLVLSRGDWNQLLGLRLVPGDAFMILATIAWSIYSWLLTRLDDAQGIRRYWAGFLLAQVVFGVAWSGLFAAGEWAIGAPEIQWNPTLFAALMSSAFLGETPHLYHVAAFVLIVAGIVVSSRR